MKVSVSQIIRALTELEAKGCHSVNFEYGNGLFRASIYNGNDWTGKLICEKSINLMEEQSELDSLLRLIETLKTCVTATVFQCYMREYVRGVKTGKWHKTRPYFTFGEKATSEMLCDGSGYYVTDPENGLQYFVDMKEVSATN
jgi:hypothetical protein